MSKRESINRQYLIMRKIKKNDCSFKEISDYLSYESEVQAYNFNVSKRTFQRDLDDIRFTFDLDIQFDHSRKVYYIESQDDSDANDRMLEAFDTFNALNLTERIANYIHFEKRKPKGTENLHGLIHAIKNQHKISFTYFNFWEDEPSIRKGDPLALKEFNNRWYVLLKDEKDNRIKTFALDRLSKLTISNTKYSIEKQFNVEEHFKYCFGIISPDDSVPEKIILSLDSFQGKYIKSLPLHESQKILIDTDDELRIQLNLCVTHDFIMELLSMGNNLKVLQPQSLIDKITSNLKSALKQYS